MSNPENSPLKKAQGLNAPQYFDDTTGQWEYAKGKAGALKVEVSNPSQPVVFPTVQKVEATNFPAVQKVEDNEVLAELKILNASNQMSISAYDKAVNAETVAGRAENTAETVRGEFDQVVAEAGSNNPEVVQARGGEVNLNARLNNVTTQLAESANLTKNADFPLKIPTYEGSGQTVHPSVLYLDTKWNGYHYWMAHTPYPNSNDIYENPSVVGSNDGVNWIHLNGAVNPIDEPTADELALGGHMSDVHLIFRSDTGALECWYRLRLKSTKVEWILRKTTRDGGITWTPREIMLDSALDGNYYLSPSILHEGGKYRMWFVGSGNKVWYTESTSGASNTWSTFVDVPIAYRSDVFTPWHLEVFKDNGKYHILLNAFRGANTTSTKRILTLGESPNGLSFNDVHLILEPTLTLNRWDNDFLYRASMIKVGDIYRMYYSAIDVNGKWKIGMVEGKSLETLNSKTYINADGAYEVDKMSAKSIQVEKEVFLFERGVGAGKIKINSVTGAISLESEQGAPSKFKAGDTELGNLTANFITASQIKKETMMAMPAQIQLAKTGSTTPYLKMLDSGRAGAGLVVGSSPHSMRVVNDGNTQSGLFEMSGIIVQPGVVVPSIEGAIKFNTITKKHEGFDGTKWNNLY